MRSGAGSRARRGRPAKALVLALTLAIVGMAGAGEADHLDLPFWFVTPVGDLDGDEHPDVVRVSDDLRSFDVRRGTDGSVLWSHVFDERSHAAIVGSVPDQDHDDLLVVAHRSRPSGVTVPLAGVGPADRDAVATLHDGQTGSAMWVMPVKLASAASVYHPDLATCGFSPCLRWRETVIGPNTGHPSVRAIGDANGDGSSDVFLSLEASGIAMAVDHRTGSPIGVARSEPCGPTSTQPAPDLDGDGRVDVITFKFTREPGASNDSCTASAQRWDGSVIWSALGPARGLESSGWVEFPDVTGDGHPDVAYGWDQQYSQPWIALALDGRTGTRLWSVPSGSEHRFVEDTDGDGGEDLALLAEAGLRTLSGATAQTLMSVGVEPGRGRFLGPRSHLDDDEASDLLVSSSAYWDPIQARSSSDGSSIWTTTELTYPLGADVDGNGRDDVFGWEQVGANYWIHVRDGGTRDLLGSFLFHAAQSFYWFEIPQMVHAVDLTNAPGVEILAGRGAFRYDGTELWIVP